MFRSGSTPEDGEAFFRVYNLLVLVVVVLLTTALVHLPPRLPRRGSRSFRAGRSTVLARQALVATGCLPAVVLGVTVLDGTGVPEDWAGLPPTILCGTGWLLWGIHARNARRGGLRTTASRTRSGV